MRVAVNGFGRIGRLVTRILLTQGRDIELIAINDPAPIDAHAYLLKHDSNFGRFALPVRGLAGDGSRDQLLMIAPCGIGPEPWCVGLRRAPLLIWVLGRGCGPATR